GEYSSPRAGWEGGVTLNLFEKRKNRGWRFYGGRGGDAWCRKASRRSPQHEVGNRRCPERRLPARAGQGAGRARPELPRRRRFRQEDRAARRGPRAQGLQLGGEAVARLHFVGVAGIVGVRR